MYSAKKLTRSVPLLVLFFIIATAKAEETLIESEFLGAWSLDVEATTQAIMAAEDLPEGMLDQWQGFAAAIIQYDRIITANSVAVEMRIKGRDEKRNGIPERGENLVVFDSERDGAMVYVMKQDPRHCPSGCTPEQERFFHLKLREDGSLQVRESRMSGWDRSDPMMRLLILRPKGDST